MEIIHLTSYLAFFLPLIAFLWAGLFKKILPRPLLLGVSIFLLIIAAISFNLCFYYLYQEGNDYNFFLLSWIDFPNKITSNLALKLDRLSGIMGIVVLNISALVHLYSLGYMKEDPEQEKFISFLSLFTFFMLTLIFADNLLQLFIGWEGVGLASYLLIGFWYNKKSATKAATKAFLVNRVADLGLIISMGLIISFCNSLDFNIFLQEENLSLLANQTLYGYSVLDWVALCLLIGAMGKSAQIFLHVWLADAMEGPTPVSALIHAATMVTAGLFLLARNSPLFELAPKVLDLIIIIGLATAIFAATIALVQVDIKKVIAYSTCSQLGYMFFAAGLSAYPQAIFHLFTHAFFKALLFLGAGSVIHGLGGEQDLRKMGNLKKYLPITYFFFFIGSLAISGIFPLAGFFSKDAILAAARDKGSYLGDIAYYGGLLVAFLTAIYSWRLLILTFDGKRDYQETPHESGFTMLLPLACLSLGAIFSGYLGEDLAKVDFWQGAILVKSEIALGHQVWFIEYLPMILAILGILLSYLFYHPYFSWGRFIVIKPLKALLFQAYFFDCFYHYLFVKPIKILGKIFYKFFDKQVFGGFINLLTKLVTSITKLTKSSGNLQDYLLILVGFFSLFALYWNLLSSTLYLDLGLSQEELLSLGLLISLSYFLFYKIMKS
jgi:NADH-quinone oxidoreductase subunit L